MSSRLEDSLSTKERELLKKLNEECQAIIEKDRVNESKRAAREAV